MPSIRYRGQTDHTDTQKYEKGDFRHWIPPLLKIVCLCGGPGGNVASTRLIIQSPSF